jgi:hypothetical protein
MSSERDSGVRPSGGIPHAALAENSTADEAIRKANNELSTRTGDLLAHPVAVLIEQRDAALASLATLRASEKAARDALVIEQDSFITFLMGEQEQKTNEMRTELAEQARAFQLQLALAQSQQGAPLHAATSSGRPDTDTDAATGELKQLLEAAYAEIDDTRQDAVKLQEERDEAIRAVDDIKVELYSDVEKARDEAFQIQTELDNTNRMLEDARDASRDRNLEFAEELDQARRALDDRNDEVRRLRGRLSDLTAEARHSRPPPPPASGDLLEARQEAQTLRRQLIEAKREVSRLTRELQLASQIRAKAPPAKR